MPQPKFLWVLVATVGLLLAGSATLAFEFIDRNGSKWPGARTTVYTGIPGTSPSGVPWATAYADAANEWSDKTRFEFQVNPGYRDPCAGTRVGSRFDNLNGADFRPNVCGDNFTTGTLAVTMFFTQGNMLGSRDIVEADIVFNSNVNFDVFDTPGPISSGGAVVYDFRRIALHELGHVLGLGHEESRSAIMAPRIGSITRLQSDDINGVNALYSGIDNCANRPASFGWTFGRLEAGDCVVKELMQGGTDNSFVDVYTLDVPANMRITIDMKGDSLLDGALLLTDRNLRVLSFDENSGGNCNPRVSLNVLAGEYTILANTYSGSTPCATRNTGDYRLTVSYSSWTMLALVGRDSFAGGQTNARFFGGVTANDGRNFINKVSPSQRFDVRGRIEIDPVHQGKPGFITVAALLDTGEILIRNSAGDLLPYQPDVQFVPVSYRKVLGSVENVDILRNVIAAELGINTIEVGFVIGYGVDSNPDELYFHQQPINLVVE